MNDRLNKCVMYAQRQTAMYTTSLFCQPARYNMYRISSRGAQQKVRKPVLGRWAYLLSGEPSVFALPEPVLQLEQLLFEVPALPGGGVQSR
eukprot:scaffold443138_cov18-Prasinocladus_malaysianus.AAC.1